MAVAVRDGMEVKASANRKTWPSFARRIFAANVFGRAEETKQGMERVEGRALPRPPQCYFCDELFE